jgi:hypothetical protein
VHTDQKHIHIAFETSLLFELWSLETGYLAKVKTGFVARNFYV